MSAGNTSPAAEDYLAREARARMAIDRMLALAGWAVQDADAVNLSAARGVAVREFVLAPGHGRADYLLFVDRQALGVLEAKPEGTILANVEPQRDDYAEGMTDDVDAPIEPLPFTYMSTGTETRFRNGLDPDARTRDVFAVHRPETLAEWASDYFTESLAPTLRHRLQRLPELDTTNLWSAQIEAIRNLEVSLAEGRPRALIQMATGSGKTYTAANIAYRLIRFGNAKRILFLVDRANLGRQTLKEFQAFAVPGTGHKFTELYNVQHLASNTIDGVSRVTISTIQRLFSTLKGEELPEELDEESGYEALPDEPVSVAYNPLVPPETFDVVIVDECHRSIFGLWRQVLDYFDAFTIGLTATPNKQAFGFFKQNLVMEYGHDEAVADKVNVDFDVYRIRTEITERGSTVDAGLVTGYRDRQTREVRWEKLDDEVTYGPQALDRAVVAEDQIRTVIETFRKRLFTEIFPGRTEVPKTLIFAKDDSHADDILKAVREEFGKGDEFAAKITYRQTARKAEELLASFRNSYFPRIAVTVDMIATGTDVKPLECVFFMRAVKSRTFFEQMKGRGVRVIEPDDLRAVTPDAPAKDRFVIVDAVGVTETDLSETVPLDRKPTVALDKLFKRLSYGNRDPEVLSTIAGRLARLDLRLTKADREEVETLAGMPLQQITHGIVSALDPDVPEDERTARIDAAAAPLADNPELRQRLLDIRRSYEQLLDEVSADTLMSAGFSRDATERARATVDSFREFIEQHRDEIAALQILYSRPQSQRLTYKEVKELANAIGRPPRSWTPDSLWHAYEALDASRVYGSGHRILTDLVQLVRFALEQEDELVPFPEVVRERYDVWLLQQANAGKAFDPEQLAWLERIRDTIAASLGITRDDLMGPGFVERGGLGKAYELFGEELDTLLDELTRELVA
ncbi:MAG TPA: DEAD/DEAH box helicase family protein [Gaiellaceae bacterium]|nr:DEAD/DEAH box helicase family protein [Gaiellaceae bacterium]